MTKTNDYVGKDKVLIGIILLIILYLTYVIIIPFIPALILGMVVAYMFYPIYQWLVLKIKNKQISSLLLSLSIIFVFLLPSSFILNSVTNEAISTVNFIKALPLEDIDICPDSIKICEKISLAVSLGNKESITETVLTKLLNSIVSYASRVALSIPTIFINTIIFVFSLYYFFLDGPNFVEYVKSFLPFNEIHKRKIHTTTIELTHAIVFGLFATAFIEGLIALIGFSIAGVTAPILLSLVVALFVFIPLLGASLVWIPIVIIQIYSGQIWQAAVVICCGLCIAYIDSFTKAQIIGSRANVHPLLILFGLLGGLIAFGFIGIIIGPIVLAFLNTILSIYLEKEN